MIDDRDVGSRHNMSPPFERFSLAPSLLSASSNPRDKASTAAALSPVTHNL